MTTDTIAIQREKNETLVLLQIFSFLVGVGLYVFEEKAGVPKPSGLMPFGEPVSMQSIYIHIVNLFCIAFLLRWFMLDARQRDFKMPTLLIGLIVLSYTIGSVVYFAKTRERKDAKRVTLRIVSFVFGCIMLWMLGYMSISIVMGA